MNEQTGAEAPAGVASPGRLLREAREKQGLHIAALAAAIKVTPKKLEALEADRFDALPDATFARALAQTVCRALKIDPAPVMRLLPPPSGHRLETVGEGLNTPFRERPGVLVQSSWPEALTSPWYWLAGLLLLAALAVFVLPPAWLGGAIAVRPASAPAGSARVESGAPGAAADAASPASAAAPTASAVVDVLAPAEPPVTPAEAASAPQAGVVTGIAPGGAASSAAEDAMPAGVLQLRTTAASWVEVTDGRGQPLVSRLLKPGEAVGLDGETPLRVRIGNAAGTELVYRGQAMDLKAFTRDNVARLELR
jgi:cytoskeleton protein RodZ